MNIQVVNNAQWGHLIIRRRECTLGKLVGSSIVYWMCCRVQGSMRGRDRKSQEGITMYSVHQSGSSIKNVNLHSDQVNRNIFNIKKYLDHNWKNLLRPPKFRNFQKNIKVYVKPHDGP